MVMAHNHLGAKSEKYWKGLQYSEKKDKEK